MARSKDLGRAGNYAQDVDPRGMDDAMQRTLKVGKYKPEKPRTKVERDYIKGGSPTAGEAIRRARRANKKSGR